MDSKTNPWHERFQKEEYVYGTVPNAFVSEKSSILRPKGETLCIAEGEGRNAVYLAEQGLKVTTWDYAASGLEKTRKLAETRNVPVQTKLVDLGHAQWQSHQWDQIVCVFGHFPEQVRHKTLQGVRDAVKPGGYYLTEVYSNAQLPYKSGGPKDLDFLYKPEDFLDTFKGWKFIHFFMGEVERNEGALHHGLSHVIQFIGQKPE